MTFIIGLALVLAFDPSPLWESPNVNTLLLIVLAVVNLIHAKRAKTERELIKKTARHVSDQTTEIHDVITHDVKRHLARDPKARTRATDRSRDNDLN